jgi:two-component system phosphate regulon sensor histidine kinase PhoR
MIEGVIAVDERRRIVLANRAAGLLFEFRPSTVEGRPLLEVVRNHAVHEAVTTALATSQPQRLEAKSGVVRGSPDPAPSGTVGRPATTGDHPGTRHVDIHVQPLPGQPCPGVVLVIHDTTELRRLESLRRDFIANVSHELKTPLSSIKAYTETLRNGALEDRETSQKFLARIEEQTDRLHHLIMDMLMLARIESDQHVFEIVAVDVPEVVASCLEDHRPAAEAKHISLSIEADPLPCQARADREGLREILNNLIDNAIKYTPEGGQVSVSWRCDGSTIQHPAIAECSRLAPRDEVPLAEREDYTCVVQIAVRDTGIGIKPEDQRRVFERFYRVDKARSRELGGTGLGLAIVKHLVQSFGGNIRVESEPGQGSTFTVELPAA